MKCLSVLTCSKFADGALFGAELERAAEHIQSCESCRACADSFALEAVALRSALRFAEDRVVVPEFLPRPALPNALAWMTCVLLLSWAVNLAWVAAGSVLRVPDWLSWLLPGSTSTGVELLVDSVRLIFTNSGVWLNAAMAALVPFVLVVLGGAGIWLLGQRRASVNPVFCMMLGVLGLTITAAPETQAFELRHDEQSLTIAADEVIDDSVILSAERVVVEGKINGDLIVLGERVRIQGFVGGSVIVAAEELTIEGKVQGNVVAAGELVDMRGAVVGGNIYSVGESVTLRPESTVAGNVLLAGETLEIHADVSRDLIAVGEETTVYGAVANQVRVYGGELELAEGANVEGSLFAMLASEENFTLSPAASVAGDTSINRWPEGEGEDSPLEGLLGVILKTIAAMLCGLLLFWLLPSLRAVEFVGLVDGLAVGLFGAVALVATPVLAVLLLITLIGAPIGFVAGLLWLMALYISGLVAANYLGRVLLDDSVHGWVKPLLLGIVVVIALISVPFVGDLLRVIAMVVGAGLLVRWMRDGWAMRGLGA